MAVKNNNWAKDLDYQRECVLAVCKQLKLTDPNEIAYITKVASHSISDGNFFSKIKTLYSLNKKDLTAKEEKKKEEKVLITFGEYNDGKTAELPPLLKERLKDLSSDS